MSVVMTVSRERGEAGLIQQQGIHFVDYARHGNEHGWRACW